MVFLQYSVYFYIFIEIKGHLRSEMPFLLKHDLAMQISVNP